jgi:predicted HicB family RNase H-like nuclease
MPSASPEKNRRDVARFRENMRTMGYRQVHAWIPDDLRSALVRMALAQQKSLSEVISEALQREVDKEERETDAENGR